MAEPNWLHGKDGAVKLGADAVGAKEYEATEWSGNPFEVDIHRFATFKGAGANSATAGLESGRDLTITIKASAEDDIRAADSALVEGARIWCELREPDMADGSGHTGMAVVQSCHPPRVVTNAEMEYQLRAVSIGKWTRGVRAAVPPPA